MEIQATSVSDNSELKNMWDNVVSYSDVIVISFKNVRPDTFMVLLD